MAYRAHGKAGGVRLLERFRAARLRTYEGLFSARALCITGLIIMPAMLFNPSLPFRILYFFFFWFLACLAGKKNNPLFTFLVFFGIVAVNLIVPYGQVLFSIGAFKITSGALLTGIHRAATLEALIMLSRVTIRQDLKIPGLFGELAGESFRILALIVGRKQRITRKNLIADIDNLMLELSGDDGRAPETGAAPALRTKPAGFVILAVAAILSWLPWIAS